MSIDIRMTQDAAAAVQRSLRALMKKEVLVGIPASQAEKYRQGGGQPLNNAQIGYWMEFGVPSRNVPARPSLVPGVQSVLPAATEQLLAAITAVVTADPNQVNANGRLHAAGMIASSGVKNYINDGVGPALSEYTLRKRAARGGTTGVAGAAQQELDNRANVPGYVPSLDIAKPLVDTAQFRNSITYVIKSR